VPPTAIHRHAAFVDMVRQHSAQPQREPPPLYKELGRAPNRPLDLPAYGRDFMRTEQP
jgi:5'-phosphate synthase pdxT subunit